MKVRAAHLLRHVCARLLVCITVTVTHSRGDSGFLRVSSAAVA